METNTRRAKLHAVIAAVMLLLMALFWSLDNSFFYVLFGAAGFFLFLAYSSWTMAAPTMRVKGATGKKQRPPTPDIFSSFKKAFQQEGATGTAETASTGMDARSRRVIMMASSFIFGVFLIITIATLLTSGNDYTDDFGRAESFYFGGEYDSAYRYYRNALAINSDCAECLNALGSIKWMQKDFDSALYYYDAALQADPGFTDAQYNKATYYYERKDYDAALKELESIIARRGDYYNAYLLAGDCYYMQQNYEDAIAYYEPAYESGVRSANLTYIMAYIYDQKGETDKAITLYQETLSYDSSIVDIYKRLGELLPGEEGQFYRARGINKQW